jgi:hypothetical protein
MNISHIVQPYGRGRSVADAMGAEISRIWRAVLPRINVATRKNKCRRRLAREWQAPIGAIT